MFLDNIFNEILIYNYIKKFIKILLIQIIYTSISQLINQIRKKHYYLFKNSKKKQITISNID